MIHDYVIDLHFVTGGVLEIRNIDCLYQAPEVLHEVRGLRWGSYAGSPADDRPILALVQLLKTPAACVTSISGTELLLMPPHTHLVTAGVEKGLIWAGEVISDLRH